MTNLTLPVLMVKQPTRPVRSRSINRDPITVDSFAVEQDAVDATFSVLPSIDGRGLTQAEWFKVNGRANKVKADVARDMPEATDGELHAMGQRAAVDALRDVLRARPAATTTIIVADDRDSIDVADDEESDPETWGPEWDEFVWEPTEPEEATLTLAGLIESEAAVMRARGLAAFDLMSDHLVELARIVRTVSAERPDQVWERVSILDRDFSDGEREPELTSAGRWA